MFCHCSGILLVIYQDQEVFLPGANWTLHLWFSPCSDVSDTGDNRSQESTQGVLALLLASVALMHYWPSAWPDFWRGRNFFPLRLSVTVVCLLPSTSREFCLKNWLYCQANRKHFCFASLLICYMVGNWTWLPRMKFNNTKYEATLLEANNRNCCCFLNIHLLEMVEE